MCGGTAACRLATTVAPSRIAPVAVATRPIESRLRTAENGVHVRPQNPRTSRAPLLTAAEVAEQLNVSLRSVRRMIADGRLPFVRIGRSVRIRPEALEAMIEAK